MTFFACMSTLEERAIWLPVWFDKFSFTELATAAGYLSKTLTVSNANTQEITSHAYACVKHYRLLWDVCVELKD